MKRRFTSKVVVLFSTLLLLFSTIATVSYQLFYTRSFLEHTRSSLMRDAYNISKNISEEVFLQDRIENPGDLLKEALSGTDLILYERLISADFYLVDPDYVMYANEDHTLVEKPVDARFQKAVEEAFAGSLYSVSEKAEEDQTELICAVPVTNKNNERLCVIVVRTMIPPWYHSSNNGTDFLFLALFVSFLIVIFIAVLSSHVLARPIKQLNESTQELVKEKYDVRNSIHREDELGQLASSLNTLAAKMEKDAETLRNEEEYKRRFLSQISHELKTPVTIMRGSLELLSDGFVQDETKKQEYYAQMLAQSEQLQHRIHEILDLTKLQTPEFEMNKTWNSLTEILSEAVMDLRPLLEKKNMELHWTPREEDDEVYCDCERMRQMLVILLDNAVKYSKEGQSIEVDYDRNHIRICDHGIGMSKDALKRIGEPYYRAATQVEGNGLGLCIVKEICKRHDAQLVVESEEGQGTQITIELSRPTNNE